MAGNLRRLTALRALLRAVRSGRRPGAPSMGERFRALPRLLHSAVRGSYPGLGWGRLAMALVAVAYVVAPSTWYPRLCWPSSASVMICS